MINPAPTNNDWRIAGSLGLEVEPTDSAIQEVLTQGLGFPLRPVANVPLTTTPEVPTDVVAEGLFMQFIPQGYEVGKYYAKGSTVSNGEWTMVADKLTLEYPFPMPEGDPTFALPAFTPATQSDLSVVYSGHLYTFTEAVWAKTLRVWVTQLTVDTHYRVVVVTKIPDKAAVTAVVESPILTVGAWKNVALLNQLLPAGTTLLVYLDALNSGSDQEVTGGWTFTGQSQNNPPAVQAWNHDNAQALVRISKTDLDSADRTAELLGIIPDSTLQFADTSNPSAFNVYRVTGTAVDQGAYVEYPVVLQEQGEGGAPLGTTTLTASVPIALATEYAEEVGSVPLPTWATAQGYLAYDGVEQVSGQANSYGVDIECDPATIPNDWKILAYSTL